MNLRERDKSKELGAPFFRYKPHNYLEKLKDAIRNKNSNALCPVSEAFKTTMMDKKGNLKPDLVALMP